MYVWTHGDRLIKFHKLKAHKFSTSLIMQFNKVQTPLLYKILVRYFNFYWSLILIMRVINWGTKFIIVRIKHFCGFWSIKLQVVNTLCLIWSISLMYFWSSWIQTLFPLCSMLTKPFWKSNAEMQTGQDARPFLSDAVWVLEAHFLSGVYSTVVTQPQTSLQCPAASAQFKVYNNNSGLCSLCCEAKPELIYEPASTLLLNIFASTLELCLSLLRINAEDYGLEIKAGCFWLPTSPLQHVLIVA